jgi:hypothetical protein
MSNTLTTNTMKDLSILQKNVANFVRRYAEIVHGILTDPVLFFQNQGGKTDLAEPTIFAFINILFPKLFYALLFAPITLGLSFLALTISFFINICLFIGVTGLIYAFTVFFGRREDFLVTYRCTAYASVAFLAWLIPIPFANLVIFSSVFCILLFFAINENQQLNETPAVVFLFVLNFLIVIGGVIITFTTIWLLIRVIFLFAQSL